MICRKNNLGKTMDQSNIDLIILGGLNVIFLLIAVGVDKCKSLNASRKQAANQKRGATFVQGQR
tara:strand:+ start:34 stop:225 length:192 start_codon:yes stop_codon:yes gene_type:complete